MRPLMRTKRLLGRAVAPIGAALIVIVATVSSGPG
jgi:flagellin-like protein